MPSILPHENIAWVESLITNLQLTVHFLALVMPLHGFGGTKARGKE